MLYEACESLNKRILGGFPDRSLEHTSSKSNFQDQQKYMDGITKNKATIFSIFFFHLNVRTSTVSSSTTRPTESMTCDDTNWALTSSASADVPGDSWGDTPLAEAPALVYEMLKECVCTVGDDRCGGGCWNEFILKQKSIYYLIEYKHSNYN